MRSLDLDRWSSLDRDLGKWLKQGLVVFQRGALVVKNKPKDMNEEEKRQYQLMEIKIKMHNRISDLGVRVYTLMSAKGRRNPSSDSRVKDLIAHIKWYEAVITLLEKKRAIAVRQRIRKTV